MKVAWQEHGPKFAAGRILAMLLAALALPSITSRVVAEPPAVVPATAADSASPSTMEEIKSLERRVKQVIAKVQPAVVEISGAAGVVVSPDGMVLSVAHVGGRAGRPIRFTFPDGRTANGVTLGNDHVSDAALMKITDPGPWPFAPMGTSADLQEGQWCVLIGHPVSFSRSRSPSVRIGRVLHQCPLHVVTDGTIMGGDSGGPLFDLEGRVVGIGSTCDDSVLQNVHVPMERFRENWDRLVKGENLDGRTPARIAFLGVSPDPQVDSARVSAVVPGSAAEKAGIKPGDVILKFCDHEVRKYDDLPPLVRQHKPGEKVQVEVQRGEKVIALQVTLGESEG